MMVVVILSSLSTKAREEEGTHRAKKNTAQSCWCCCCCFQRGCCCYGASPHPIRGTWYNNNEQKRNYFCIKEDENREYRRTGSWVRKGAQMVVLVVEDVHQLIGHSPIQHLMIGLRLLCVPPFFLYPAQNYFSFISCIKVSSSIIF